MSIEAMETQDVLSVAAQLDVQVDALNQTLVRVEALHNRIPAIWEGRDALMAVDWWTQQHKPAFSAAVGALTGYIQSIRNNASEQSRASSSEATPGGPAIGGSTGGRAAATAVGAGVVATAVGAGAAESTAGTHTTARSAQAAYDAWVADHRDDPRYARFGPGGESNYQCTGWANFRWAELGYKGGPIGGDGGAMAANVGGSVDTPPTQHAMASYGTGNGHVMIVEDVMDGGNRIRVSEMNTDRNWEVALPSEYKATNELVRQADGTWVKYGDTNVGLITFASLPR